MKIVVVFPTNHRSYEQCIVRPWAPIIMLPLRVRLSPSISFHNRSSLSARASLTLGYGLSIALRSDLSLWLVAAVCGREGEASRDEHAEEDVEVMESWAMREGESVPEVWVTLVGQEISG